MHRTIRLIAAASALVAGTAMAATDGDLGATSTGTFTNTINATGTCQVQVLDLKDATVHGGTLSASYSVDGSTLTGLGVEDRFCVVNTCGSSVEMVASNTNGFVGGVPLAVDGTTSDEMRYLMYFEDTVGGAGLAFNDSNDALVVATPPTLPGFCGSGNVRKVMMPLDGANPFTTLPTDGNIYVDQITLVATPQ